LVLAAKNMKLPDDRTENANTELDTNASDAGGFKAKMSNVTHYNKTKSYFSGTEGQITIPKTAGG